MKTWKFFRETIAYGHLSTTKCLKTRYQYAKIDHQIDVNNIESVEKLKFRENNLHLISRNFYQIQHFADLSVYDLTIFL